MESERCHHHTTSINAPYGFTRPSPHSKQRMYFFKNRGRSVLQYRWGSPFFACRAHEHTHALMLLRSAPRCSLRPKLGQESSVTPQGQAMQFHFILRAHHRSVSYTHLTLPTICSV